MRACRAGARSACRAISGSTAAEANQRLITKVSAARRRPTEMHLLLIAMLARAVAKANGCPPAAGLLHAAFRSVACRARSGLSISEMLLPIAVAKGSAGVKQGSVVKDLVRVSQHRVPGRTLHEVLPFQGRTLVTRFQTTDACATPSPIDLRGTHSGCIHFHRCPCEWPLEFARNFSRQLWYCCRRMLPVDGCMRSPSEARLHT